MRHNFTSSRSLPYKGGRSYNIMKPENPPLKKIFACVRCAKPITEVTYKSYFSCCKSCAIAKIKMSLDNP